MGKDESSSTWGEGSEKDNVIDLTGTEWDWIRGRDERWGCVWGERGGKAEETLPVPVILLSLGGEEMGFHCYATPHGSQRAGWSGGEWMWNFNHLSLFVILVAPQSKSKALPALSRAILWQATELFKLEWHLATRNTVQYRHICVYYYMQSNITYNKHHAFVSVGWRLHRDR